MLDSLRRVVEVVISIIVAFVLMYWSRGLFILLLASSFLLVSCGISRYTSNTKATYKVTDSSGVIHEFSYDSDKDQQLIVELVKTGDKVTGLKVAVQSGTSEAALTAMARAQESFAKFMEAIGPALLKLGAMAGS